MMSFIGALKRENNNFLQNLPYAKTYWKDPIM